MRRLLLVGCLLGAGALLTACNGGAGGGTATPSGGCGADQAERLDPDSLVHILPGGPEPEYTSDPPTSGPHAPTAALGGVVDEPLDRADQVGQLEAGVVLIQHGVLDPDVESDLEALGGELVVVAPNPDLPAPVVATAWTRKLVCASLDGDALDALATFAAAHAGDGPGSDADGG